jgi:hypothetical protein
MFSVKPYEQKTLRWWYEQYLLDKLDMAPPYQRKAEIWSKWKRAHLIDSILNDFDVPKFYIASSVDTTSSLMNKKAKAFAIIDGKQRFAAVFDFFDDEIPLNASFLFDDQPTLKLAGLKYSELKAKYPWLAQKVEEFKPTVMNVLTDEPHKIDELFVRLNSGEAATGSERRNAMKGPVPPILRDLVLHPFFQRRIKFGTQRMQEYNLAAKLMMIEMRGAFIDTKAKDLDNFAATAAQWADSNPQEVHSDHDPYVRTRDRVVQVLDLLAGEFNDRDPLLASQGHIPVYYWFAREYPKRVNELRDFLEEFTNDVKEMLEVQREDPNSADHELGSYYTMGRSTNDQASLEGRYKILVKRFKSFRNPHAIGARR